jgi:hypothetical protein
VPLKSHKANAIMSEKDSVVVSKVVNPDNVGKSVFAPDLHDEVLVLPRAC